ncbi:MAG: UDP-N-acetylglucosamine 2-epimerase (non-hydrolyzing), partial [Deltaproteobacteria bacterium]|nr:UDP-N-acetylglucosamine 2-epimerase (non-hydrolyzing) [Deltaproteobacteria bacterium]
GSASHGEQTGRMLQGIEEVLLREGPDVVVVYGDTNSTLAGALAACKLHFPVAHVEAGLRSYNRAMPEEINRVVVDHVSSFLFCPTQNAVKNLRKEGIIDGDVAVAHVGDVMYDSVLYNMEIAKEKSGILRELGLLANNRSPSSPDYALVTLHRAENTDTPQRLRNIFKALDEVGQRMAVIFPLHPRTKKTKEALGIKERGKHLRLMGPVSYFDMLLLERNARVILTDSGGVQKEAFWFGVPCITLRDETEWAETVECGWNRLAGADTGRIINAIHEASGPEQSPSWGKGEGIYGDGRAGERIVTILLDRLSGNPH